MNAMEQHTGDSFTRVTEEIDYGGSFTDLTLVVETATARLYRARRCGKLLLIKTPLGDGGRALTLLQREYELAVTLAHPGIVAVHTWEPNTPVGPGIVMEYVEGRTLEQFVREKTSKQMLNRAFTQLLDAVEYIHKRGLLHNDLKPGNIMVSLANNDVKIIDFGLSDNDEQAVQRRLGGTEGYASPELRERRAAVDTRSDIYSLGAIMRDMFGSRYRAVWQRCMADSPERRYRDVEALRRAWLSRRRRPMVAAVSVLAAAFVAALALMFVQMGRVASLSSTLSEMSEASKSQTAESARLSHALDSVQQVAQRNAAESQRLNASLDSVQRERARIESLKQEYTQRFDQLTEEVLRRTRSCLFDWEASRATVEYMPLSVKLNEQFKKDYPEEADAIINEMYSSLLTIGGDKMVKVVNQLPPIDSVVPDRSVHSKIYELIQERKSWKHLIPKKQ
mgnify:FL=1